MIKSELQILSLKYFAPFSSELQSLFKKKIRSDFPPRTSHFNQGVSTVTTLVCCDRLSHITDDRQCNYQSSKALRRQAQYL